MADGKKSGMAILLGMPKPKGKEEPCIDCEDDAPDEGMVEHREDLSMAIDDFKKSSGPNQVDAFKALMDLYNIYSSKE